MSGTFKREWQNEQLQSVKKSIGKMHRNRRTLTMLKNDSKYTKNPQYQEKYLKKLKRLSFTGVITTNEGKKPTP